jgi:hypothetical protein
LKDKNNSKQDQIFVGRSPPLPCIPVAKRSKDKRFFGERRAKNQRCDSSLNNEQENSLGAARHFSGFLTAVTPAPRHGALTEVDPDIVSSPEIRYTKVYPFESNTALTNKT